MTDQLKALRRILVPPVRKAMVRGEQINVLSRGSYELMAILSEVEAGKGELDRIQIRTLKRCIGMFAKAEKVLEGK